MQYLQKSFKVYVGSDLKKGKCGTCGIPLEVVTYFVNGKPRCRKCFKKKKVIA